MPVPLWLIYPFAALFGAVWGSFLNVVVIRLPRGESVVFPASHCIACSAPIKAYDNVPVLSYLLLRGRCRHCGARFSARYAAIEALGGAAAVAVVATFGPSFAAFGFFVFLWLLIGIAAIDLKHWIIPHELSWSGIALGLLFSAWNPRSTLRSSVVGAAAAFVIFTILSWLGERIFKKEALGLGDRWLLAMEGAFLGAGALLPIVFLASLQGSVVGLGLIAFGKAQTGEQASAPPDGTGATTEDTDGWVPPKNAIPFGPFLALGAVEWLFFGPDAWGWYQAQLLRALG